MRHGSLFSGIGGFDLASEWMGWENIFHCEWNPFGQRVLNYYWPKAKSYHDITKTDFTIHRGTIDILTGGFPCQPFSTAGKQKGVDDERYLWPEMLRAIRQIQPPFVVGENVPGLVNWSRGMVFEQVQIDLENEGYEVTPFILPAAGTGAPHRRDRIWFVCRLISNPGRYGCNGNKVTSEGFDSIECGISFDEFKPLPGSGVITNPNNINWRCKSEKRIKEEGSWRQPKRSNWIGWPTQSPIYNGNDGFPGELDGIALSEWRRESVKAGGNAIVPQVALQIFKAIQEFENTYL